MVKHDDIIHIPINSSIMKNINANAKKSSMGGRSQIRINKKDRMDNLLEDQITGHLGNYALSKYLFGDGRKYLQARYIAEKTPKVGDGGEDIVGLNIDVKATLYRYISKDILDYGLAVRPKERHKDWVYVFALVDKPKEDNSTVVHLIGWLEEASLSDKVDEDGPLKGAYTCGGRNLKPLMPLRWLYL